MHPYWIWSKAIYVIAVVKWHFSLCRGLAVESNPTAQGGLRIELCFILGAFFAEALTLGSKRAGAQITAADTNNL